MTMDSLDKKNSLYTQNTSARDDLYQPSIAAHGITKRDDLF
jgi:hypothetical protein